MTSLKFWQRFVLLLLLCNGFAMLALAAPRMTSHSVTLVWTPGMQPSNIAAVSWNIYRSGVNGGPFTLIASVPGATLTYLDDKVAAGNKYFYALTCVDSAGVESAYSAAADATIPGGDFNALFDHYSASTDPSGQVRFALTMTAAGEFQGNVTLHAAGLPPLATASFSPAVIAGGSGTSTLTVTTPAATPQGEYFLTVTGNSGTLTHWTNVELLVGTVDFMGTISPAAQSVSASTGGSAQYSIALMDLGSKPFGNTATFSISGLPAGVTANFSPQAANPDTNGSSVLTLTVSTATPQGIYAPLITASGGGIAHSTNIHLTVTP